MEPGLDADVERDAVGVALRATLEATNLRGLASCARALLGDGPPLLFGAFEALPGPLLPWVPGPCWVLLAPTGVLPPRDPRALVLARFLVGAEHDPTVTTAALRAVEERAGEPPWWTPLPQSRSDIAAELWRRALVSAVGEFWDDAARAYQQAHGALSRGDVPAAVDLLERAQVAMAPTVERVAALAQHVGDHGREPSIEAVAWGVSPPGAHLPVSALDAFPDAATLPLATAGIAGPGEPGVRGEAPVPYAHVSRRDVFERAPREHPYLPLLFLLLAVAAAGVVLYAVAFGWPPQLP